MIIKQHYSLKVIQDIDEKYSDIESINIKEDISTIRGSKINGRNKLSKDTFTNERVFICKDICASYDTDLSNPYYNVPSTEDNYFLIKSSGDYMFTKENPLIEKHIDGFQLLSVNGQSYPNPLIENAQIALNLNHHNHIMNDETWTAYSFNYGGIVKADAVFFAVKFNNEIVLLENNDQTIIDYTEGMIYLNDFHYSDIRFTGGIFNIKPIKIYKKGDLNLIEDSSGYYKVLNKPDKGFIDLEYIDEKNAVLHSTENIMILLNNTDSYITLDGVLLDSDVATYVPKNTRVLISYENSINLLPESSGHITDNYTTIFENTAEFSSKLIGTFESNSDRISIEKFKPIQILIFKEFERNTYNIKQPLVLGLFEDIVQIG